MTDSAIPLEYLTTGSSIIVVMIILYTIILYKKKIGFIQKLIEEKENKKFTEQDKKQVEETLIESQILKFRIVKLTKTLYPIFILIAGIFFAFFDFKEALTHMNIIVVVFLYIHILKTNVTSYINLMQILVQK